MGFEKPTGLATSATKEWTGIRLQSGDAPIKASLRGVAELDTENTNRSNRPPRRPAGERPAFLAGLNVLRDDIRNAPRQALELGSRSLDNVTGAGDVSGRLPLDMDRVGHEVEINLQPQRPEHSANTEIPPPTPPNLAEYRNMLWPGPETASRPERRAVDGLSRGEVLKIAKDITIEGVRLKDIFTAKRIDEAGIRAVVETYLHGGDVRQQLSHEIIAKEQSFERDPQLRRQMSGDHARTLKDNGAQNSPAIAANRGVIGYRGTKLAVATRQKASKASRKAGSLLASGAKKAQHELIDKGDTAQWISITAIIIVYSLIVLLLVR